MIVCPIPSRTENNKLINVPEMAGQSSIEKGRSRSRLLCHLRFTLKGEAVDPGDITGQAN